MPDPAPLIPVVDEDEEAIAPVPVPEVPDLVDVVDDTTTPDPDPVGDDTDTPPEDPDDVEEMAQDPTPEITEPPVSEPDVAEDPAPDATPLPETPVPDSAAPGNSGPVSVVRQIAPATLDGAATVAGGRVTTFALPDPGNITGVTITGLPAQGNVTVNPDFTLALVLSGSDYRGPLSFDYSVSRADGTVTTHTAALNVTPPTQAAGWGLGNHYMLATDANDKIIVEHGDNHRKVYISGSEDALTRKDIADLAGVSEGTITAQWLRNNPEYGGSEGWALTADLGMELWYTITAAANGPASHWLLFERGYTYENLGRLATFNSNGESELAPLYISSWGTGARPVLDTQFIIFQLPSLYYVIQDVELTGGATALGGGSLLFEGVKFGDQSVFQNVDGLSLVTIRYGEFYDIANQSPSGKQWGQMEDRKQGIYTDNFSGLLLENNLFVHNGWVENYDGTPAQGQPPGANSHNAYIQFNMTDVTFRDNITAQAGSIGASLAGGAFAENNLFLDSNLSVSINASDIDIGNFTLFLDNIITAAGFKDAPNLSGAKDWGISDNGKQTVLLNNIIAHNSDPNDPLEVSFKGDGSQAINVNLSRFYDDTIIHNWTNSLQSIGTLDAAALNQITIQNFAMEFLGLDPSSAPANQNMGLYYKSGLINALMDYARENWGDGTLTARDIVDWFQAGFGFDPRSQGASDHRFIPNDLGDGVRWDNRLNWSSNELPTTGDSVDLGGNWVNYGGTVALDSLDLGSGGKLQVGSGKLSVDTLETGTAGGTVFVERAGQLWTDGYGGDTLLSLHITGGRFANTGDVSGPVIASVKGGQMIVAADDAQFVLGQQSELRLEGSSAKVGFDGGVGGVATLIMQAGGQMSFVADSAGTTSLREFRSGAWDQEGSNVHSGVALNGTLALDLTGFSGTGTLKLIEVDAIAGMFDAINIHGLGNRNAELVIDYAADLVILQLSNGNGQGSVSIRGDATYGGDENAALWDALTSGLDLGADPDASITIFDTVIDPLAEMNFI